MKIERLIAFWSMVAMLIATFVVWRVICPALINLHNDGALILVVVLIVIVTPQAWWSYLAFLNKLLKGEYS